MARSEYLLLLYIFMRAVSSEQSASFYGESYISVPLEDAESSTEVSLHFLTHRPHGLLLLAAGATDHLLLEVKAGRINLAIDLGSGEATLHSSPSVRLDDQQWHEVRVNRSGDTLTLSIDGVDQESVHTPGNFHELNIRDGVYLGGRGAYDSQRHAHVSAFRGCMKDVTFNGLQVLTAARELKSVQNAFEITWDCDSEFSARSDSPISLLSDTSFVAFSRFHMRDRGSITFDIKTRAEDAVVLFNAGKGDYKDDFLALEIVGGLAKLSLNAGGGVVEVVMDERSVSDGKWHELDLAVSRSNIEIKVDGDSNTTRFFHHNGQRSHLNLAGHLFLGGLGLKARSHALRLGLHSLQGERTMRGSMVGCVRNVVINSRPYGFREVQVSRHVDPQCSWTFPCALEPCVEDAECVESGDTFQCVCDQPVCHKEERGANGLPEEGDIGDIVAIVPLEVREGGEAVISTNNIDVVFDYRSHRIREIAIRFQVVLPPSFGSLQVDRGQRQAESFTLHDLMTAKVKYIHDGSDTLTDDITMEMSVGAGSSDVPTKLKGNFEFVLPIQVTPHHDPPKLRLPSGNQVSILADSKLQLTTSIIDTWDPDTKSQDLKYSVHFLRPVKSFFQDYAQGERATTSFSHQDLVDRRIWFNANQEDAVVDMKINVTDHSNLRDSTILRLLMVSLKVEVENNTGLVVPLSSSAILHSSNLSVVTNVPLQNLQVRYRVTTHPRHGRIQRQLSRQGEEWTEVDTFTQHHLTSSRLRYSHSSNDLSVSTDSFSFVASANEVETTEQVFQVKLRAASLVVTHSNRLVVHQVPYAQLTNTSLLVSAQFGHIDTTKLTFTVFRMPKKGDLYLTSNNRIFNPLDFDSLRPIEKGGNFSQADVNSERLYFKFDSPGFDRVEDYVDLTIQYPASGGRMMRLWMEYVPLDSAIRFTNNGLRDVPEGGQKEITRSTLYLEMDDYKQFQFSLIQPPRHGNISLYDTRTSSIVEASVEDFTSSDIRDGRVVYKHDDSENDRDSFLFAAIPLFTSEADMPQEIHEFTGTFHIAMVMRNDNPPQRTVDKVLEVVTNGRRKLTIKDLAFMDPDIHYNISTLQYRRQAISNGEILLASTNSPVYQFTQADLETEKLVFQHKGAPGMGRTSLFVSDGQFYWTGLLEVRASDPFIRIGNITGLSVLRGREGMLSSENITLDTNLDFPPISFSFVVTQAPVHGSLMLDAEECSEFTYSDVVKGRVVYIHDSSDSQEDQLRFRVIHGDVQSQEHVLPIMIEDADMRHAPHIVHNMLLTVGQGKTATITDSLLLAQHPSLNAEEVVFVIVQPPQHGHLTLGGSPFSLDDPVQFSQGDISRGLVEYVQDDVSSVVKDSFVFDVDSDGPAMKHLVFSIEVIPSSFPIQPGTLSVKEGGSAALTSRETLKILGVRYQSEELIYEIVTVPAHGHVINTDRPMQFNEAFSSDSLASGKIVYQHDDSESVNDSFTVTAATLDGSLKSQPLKVEVKVIAVDDQPPRVVVNKALSVWADSVTLLTGDKLHAEDPDTSSEDIVFTVVTGGEPTNGHLAYLNNTFQAISQFSQRDMDAGRVAFVHQGQSRGSFRFQASDGVNSDVERTFRVQAHPVVLQLVRAGPVLAFPNTIQPLSNRSLLAMTSAPNFSKPIIFTVMPPKPQHGQMVTVVGGRPVRIQSFTQGEVNEGRVFYQHLSYMQEWSQTDAVQLEISTAYATPLTNARCEIQVSFANIYSENKAMLLGLYEPSVEEGGSLAVTRHHFDSTLLHKRLAAYQAGISLTFRVLAPTIHGDLTLSQQGQQVRVVKGTTFTQEDIDAERLRYRHDDSDTVLDLFTFSVVMEGVEAEEERQEGGQDSLEDGRGLNFTISIEPINDQPFRLVTPNPSLWVLQGGQVVLNSSLLQAVDPDTGPADLVYTVLSQPDTGKLVRANDSQPLAPGDTFSQLHLDQSLLLFMQNSTSTGGSVNLMLTDGKFPPEYTILNIVVVPVIIDTSAVRTVPLTQSESSVQLSVEFLNISTNGAREALRYEVMESPAYGKIMVGGREAGRFSQPDVDAGLVTYLMLNFSASQDQFTCGLRMEKLNVDVVKQVFRVVVKPLVTHIPLAAPPGDTVAITTANLDASELSQRTRDVPVFQITSPPKKGRILRRLRKKRDMIAQPVLKPVERFTFEDVQYAKIYYVSNASSDSDASIPDRFSYILKASNAQPAVGHFFINMKEGEEDWSYATDSEEGDGDDGVEVMGATGDDDDGESNAAMIVGVVLGVLLVVVLVVVVLAVLWRRRKGQDEVRLRERTSRPRPYISGPLQLLEQPHVLIEPQSNDPLTPTSPSQGEGDQRYLVASSPSISPTHHLPHINFSHHQDPSRTPLLHSPSSSSHPRSPDLSRTEVSPAVPDCKVTPLVEVGGHEAAGGGDGQSGRSSGGGADLYDWTLMDPELLQHCRTETPVLKANQYWV